MTGLRPDSTKVWDLNTHFRDHVPDVVTVSQYFKDHGYRSISMGKIYHGGFDDALSWSEPPLKPGTGSRYVLERNLARMDEKKRAARKKGLKGKDLSRASRGPPTESAEVDDEEYSDGALATLAVQTIQQLSHTDQPFFLGRRIPESTPSIQFTEEVLGFLQAAGHWSGSKPIRTEERL
jgi:iduronate 2-sulfatase